jgi:myo-inositol catabolism protein IolS
MSRNNDKVARIPRGLGLGCWEFSDIGTGKADDQNSLSVLHAASELGVTHYDTARSYGDGQSENVVGLALQKVSGPVFVASKTRASTREETIEAVKTSLSLLHRDRVDLYYIHWPQKGFDLRPMMETLEELRTEGLIGLIGVSNFSVSDMESVAEVGTIDAHQICYNLLWRYPERDVIPYCLENGIEVVTYSSIAQGLLSNKRRGPDSFEPGDARAGTIYYKPEVWPKLSPIVEEMRTVSQEAGVSLSALAIQWVLAQPAIVSSLVGARSIEQLKSNVAAAEGVLSPEVHDELTALSAAAMEHLPDVGNIFLHYP